MRQTYFRQVAQKDGAGAGVDLWIAHCQYAMGDIQAAVPQYRHVLDTYIGSAEAKQAAQYLAKLDPTGKLQARGAGPRKSSATAIAVAGAGSEFSGNLLDRIEIVKPIIGHPDLAPATIALVKDNLRRLPPAVQNLLIQRRTKICITTTLVDKFPALGNQEGRGYDGHTYKACPGLFQNNTLIICERLVNEGTNEVEAPMGPGMISDTLYHEIGHAIDVCLYSLSAKEDYRHAYYLDIARIPPDAAGRLAYFMQKSLAGQQESFGEIAGVCLGAERTAQDIRTYFPLTMSLIKEKLNQDQMLNDSPSQIAGKKPSGRM